MHHGIKGQRWGVRRFQNEDGTLTAAGRKRYNKAFSDAEKLNNAHAVLEDFEREITKGVKKGNNILLPTDDLQYYNKLKKTYDGLQKEMTKKYRDVVSYVHTENGKNYMRTLLGDKSFGNLAVENIVELHNQYEKYSK